MGDGTRRVHGVAFILKLKSVGIPTTGGRARLVWVPRTARRVSGAAGSSLKNRQKVDHSDRKAGSFFESTINLDIWGAIQRALLTSPDQKVEFERSARTVSVAAEIWSFAFE